MHDGGIMYERGRYGGHKTSFAPPLCIEVRAASQESERSYSVLSVLNLPLFVLYFD